MTTRSWMAFLGGRRSIQLRHLVLIGIGMLGLAGCSTSSSLPPPPQRIAVEPHYLIGALDHLSVHVWHNQDLSVNVPVGPDGNIWLPLAGKVQAAGKTPSELKDDIEAKLAKYVKDPVVTVVVDSFMGPYSQQVRVVGQAVKPEALPYREHMTVLDAMIAVGGLTQFAAGDRATLVRHIDGREVSYHLNLDELLKDGDMSANAPLAPGDVIIIPQSYF